MARVERDVGAARLQDPEQRHHHPHGPFQAQPHRHLRSHTVPSQVPGQLVGAPVQLGVGHLLVAAHDRHRARAPVHLLLEELVDAPVAWSRRADLVPCLDQERALGRIEEIDARDRLLRVGDQGAQRRHEVAAVALDGRGIEQRAGVREGADDRAVGLAEVELEVELHRVGRAAGRLDSEARQIERGARVVLPREHHLEERRAGRGAAAGPQILDQLLEGQVLVGLGAQRRRRGPGRGARGRLGAPERSTRSASVLTKKPIRSSTSRRPRLADGGADDHIVLARQPGEQRRPGGEQGHEQGGAVRLAHALEPRWSARRRGGW